MRVPTGVPTACWYRHSTRPSPSSMPSHRATASRRALHPPARLSSSSRLRRTQTNVTTTGRADRATARGPPRGLPPPRRTPPPPPGPCGGALTNGPGGWPPTPAPTPPTAPAPRGRRHCPSGPSSQPLVRSSSRNRLFILFLLHPNPPPLRWIEQRGSPLRLRRAQSLPMLPHPLPAGYPPSLHRIRRRSIAPPSRRHARRPGMLRVVLLPPLLVPIHPLRWRRDHRRGAWLLHWPPRRLPQNPRHQQRSDPTCLRERHAHDPTSCRRHPRRATAMEGTGSRARRSPANSQIRFLCSLSPGFETHANCPEFHTTR